MTIGQIALSFYFYSLVGWVNESLICAPYNSGRFINRGFLIGPWCPIYGVGAIVCYLLFGDIANPLLQFVVSAAVCGIIEYATGYVMEKLFHAKWWDYSDRPFNINGRVYLLGIVFFGAGIVLVCRFVQPWLLGVMEWAGMLAVRMLAVALTVVFLADLAMTLASWKNLNRTLGALCDQLRTNTDQALGDASSHVAEKIPAQVEEFADGLRVRLQLMNVRLSKRDLRFFQAFPDLQLPRYEETLQKLDLKERIKGLFEKH